MVYKDERKIFVKYYFLKAKIIYKKINKFDFEKE